MNREIKILAIDDDSANLAIIERIVDNEFQFRSTKCGIEALHLVETYSPDLILLDVVLKDISGFDICKKLKSSNSHEPPKIIMISGKSTVEEKLEGYAVGADDYLVKPFNAKELMAKIRVFTRLIDIEKKYKNLAFSLEQQVEERSIELVKTKQLAFLGMHMAETIHNLKNPLSIIKAASSLLHSKNLGGAYTEKILRGCDKLEAIIKSILSDSVSTQTNAQELVDINSIIENEIELAKGNENHKSVIITSNYDTSIPKIKASSSHLIQVIGNLLENSMHAMYSCNEKKILVQTSMKHKYAQIVISDTGTGISNDNLQKLFTPFFTTKPLQSENHGPTGTGLGLSSCKKMIESYGGQIKVESQLNVGTTFKITLPTL